MSERGETLQDRSSWAFRKLEHMGVRLATTARAARTLGLDALSATLFDLRLQLLASLDELMEVNEGYVNQQIQDAERASENVLQAALAGRKLGQADASSAIRMDGSNKLGEHDDDQSDS